jgi:hypothetical protein
MDKQIKRLDETDEYEHEIDKRDEEQILEELKGNLIEKSFYEFTDKSGRRIIGISYTGIKQIAQAMKGFETVSIDLRETPDEYICCVVVRNKNNDLTLPGGAQQPKMITYTDMNGNKQTVRDDKAVAKVIAKAVRNAIRSTIPEEHIKELYEEWKKKRERGM